MTLKEAIAKFKERCENDPRIQELKEKIAAKKAEEQK